MARLLHWCFLTALGIMALMIWFSFGRSVWLENVYATRWFPLLARMQRAITGGIPFSVGDVLYCAAGGYIVWQLVKMAQRFRRKQGKVASPWQPLLNMATLLLFAWVYFYLCWGMNYYRLGIAHQLQIQKDSVTRKELIDLTQLLAQKVSQSKQQCIDAGDTILQSGRAQNAALHAFRCAEKTYPFLRYRTPSFKASIFGTVGNYVGFLGYYNPFTGEAQLNVKGPAVVQPYVACHEIAHQLGYASESEANFVAFLVGAKAKDRLLQYATYLDMFMYAAGNLQMADSIVVEGIVKSLHPGVRKDLRYYRDFYRKHRIFLTAWVDRFYDWYLRANRQEQGLNSYSEVVSWLIAYQRQYSL